jgi:hypothetical protein
MKYAQFAQRLSLHGARQAATFQTTKPQATVAVASSSLASFALLIDGINPPVNYSTTLIA